jgi:hypothetical protein
MPARRFPPPWSVEEVLGWIAARRGIHEATAPTE